MQQDFALKKICTIPLLFFLSIAVRCFSQQTHFSIATDFDIQHSFKKEQRYWAIGQTVQAHFHLTAKQGIYLLISYYAPGKFNNDLTAIAKSSATTPQQISYVNNVQMRFKGISMGWRQYLKGAFDNEDSWNLYAYAGFGLMLGRVQNTSSIQVDTVSYNVPVKNGKANFKRLTMDLGLGWEILLGGDIFFYNEARIEIPTTDYPSPYLFVNKNAPLAASLNFGVRILIN